jgi:hypothetical protein
MDLSALLLIIDLIKPGYLNSIKEILDKFEQVYSDSSIYKYLKIVTILSLLLFFITQFIVNKIFEFLYKKMLRVKAYLSTKIENDLISLKVSKQANNSFSNDQRAILKNWLITNIRYPYASSSDLHQLSIKTNLTEKQVLKWIYNTRNKKWFKAKLLDIN